MHQMVMADEEIRRTLKGTPSIGEDYAARVSRLKREQLYALSKSKHETVERKLHERYDIGGFERYRVLPSNVRPTEWPTPLRKSSKERDRGQLAHQEVQRQKPTEAGRPSVDTINDREQPDGSKNAKKDDDEVLEA